MAMFGNILYFGICIYRFQRKTSEGEDDGSNNQETKLQQAHQYGMKSVPENSAELIADAGGHAKQETRLP